MICAVWLCTLAAAMAAPPDPSLMASSAATHPHIVFILADDYGYNDVGYNQNAVSSANPAGQPTANATDGLISTPHIDMLSAQGVRLENYYVQPLCSPTRSTIMTGRYASHTGVGPDVILPSSPYAVPRAEAFLPEHLRRAGYATHMVGKVLNIKPSAASCECYP
jgi:arylsulfatase A-like enzyme